MNVKIHTKAITGSRMAKEGEEPAALFGFLLEVDGHLIEEAYKSELVFEEGFVTLKTHLYPGTFEILPHTEETWAQIQRRLDEARAEQKARTGLGLVVASAE